MHSFVAFTAAHPIVFHVVAFTAFFAFVVAAVHVSTAPNSTRLTLAFVGSLVAAVAAWRWPVLYAPYPLNPDEALWTAGALKEAVDPVPWRGFNGWTSGPLNSEVLVLPGLFGANISFFTTRFVGLCLVIVTLVAFYFAMRWLIGASAAAVATVAPVTFYSFTTDHDFVHYSSEHLPVCLTTIALAAAAFLFRPDATARAARVAATIAGLTAGATLLAKLQAAPVAALVAAFAAVSVVRRQCAARERGILLILLIGGAAFAPVVVLLVVSATGQLHYAYMTYVIASQSYVAGAENGPAVGLPFFFATAMSYSAFLIAAIVCLAGAMPAAVKGAAHLRSLAASWASCAAMLLVSWYVIYKPHRGFPHYLLFSIVPVAWLVANSIAVAESHQVWRRRPRAHGALVSAIFCIAAVSAANLRQNEFLKNLAYYLTNPRSPEATAVSRYAKRGDWLVVWGWAPEYYVYTGTRMSVRDGDTSAESFESALRPYFRSVFMADIARRPPVAFVDAVAPGSFFRMTNRATQGYETFPELAQFVATRYVLKEEINGVRVFARK